MQEIYIFFMKFHKKTKFALAFSTKIIIFVNKMLLHLQLKTIEYVITK